jgi:hypothetical protein
MLGDWPAARRQLAVAHAGAYAELGEDHPLTRAVDAALREVEAPMPSAPVSVPVPRPRRRAWRVVAGVAGGLGTLAVLGGAVAAVLSGSATPGPARAAAPVTSAVRVPTSAAATETRGAPRDVVLRDDGASITVTWSDPTGGTGAVLLSVARAGQPAGPVRTLPPGTRVDVLTGLDPAVDYCVVLAVAYADDVTAPATRVCTRRGRGR